jgi:polysaccharide biosynthesis protein PslG
VWRMARGPRKRTLAAAIALCALAWPAGAGVAAPSRASSPQASRAAASRLLGGVNVESLGFDANPAPLAGELAAAGKLDAKLVRVEIPWSVMEPSAPGAIDPQALAFTDQLVADAQAQGIKVIMMVESTPCWDSSAPARLLARCSARKASAANAWPPRDDADYGAFVAYLAQRYGPDLAALEIWNEPDESNEHYLAGPDKPQQYAAILRAAYPAIKQVDPSVPVLAGALVGSNGAFLRALYEAGIKGFYNGLAVHFYNLTLASVRSIHEVQLENGDDTPVWLSEFGYSSCWPRRKLEQEQACVTRKLQASDLASIVRSLARVPYLAAAVVYKLQDSDGEEFGLLTAGGARKPSFAALAGALASPLASPGRVTLSLRRAGRRVIASGSAPPGDFMRLQVSEGGVLRYYALFKLDRFNRYAIPLPPQLGTHGLAVTVYQYWQGPALAARRSI